MWMNDNDAGNCNVNMVDCLASRLCTNACVSEHFPFNYWQCVSTTNERPNNIAGATNRVTYGVDIIISIDTTKSIHSLGKHQLHVDADVTAVAAAAAAVTINIIIQIAINLYMAFSSGKRSMPSHVYTHWQCVVSLTTLSRDECTVLRSDEITDAPQGKTERDNEDRIFSIFRNNDLCRITHNETSASSNLSNHTHTHTIVCDWLKPEPLDCITMLCCATLCVCEFCFCGQKWCLRSKKPDEL